MFIFFNDFYHLSIFSLCFLAYIHFLPVYKWLTYYNKNKQTENSMYKEKYFCVKDVMLFTKNKNSIMTPLLGASVYI